MKISILKSGGKDHKSLSGVFDIFMVRTSKGRFFGLWAGGTSIWKIAKNCIYLGKLNFIYKF